MKPTGAILTLLISLTTCMASDIGNTAGELLTRKLLAQTGDDSPGSHASLERLEMIALGRGKEASGDLRKRVGAPERFPEGLGLEDIGVRSYALRQIGECRNRAAFEFLMGLTPEDLGQDPAGQLKMALSDAKAAAHYIRIQDPTEKVHFLVATLNTTSMWWAAETLCDSGETDTLPEIRKTICQRRCKNTHNSG